MVDQRKEPANKEYGITYTLTLDQFKPTASEFDLYHSTFPKGYKGYGYIQLSEGSSIYLKSDNQKTLITPAQLSTFSQPAGDSNANFKKKLAFGSRLTMKITS